MRLLRKKWLHQTESYISRSIFALRLRRISACHCKMEGAPIIDIFEHVNVCKTHFDSDCWRTKQGLRHTPPPDGRNVLSILLKSIRLSVKPLHPSSFHEFLMALSDRNAMSTSGARGSLENTLFSLSHVLSPLWLLRRYIDAIFRLVWVIVFVWAHALNVRSGIFLMKWTKEVINSLFDMAGK